ncbi:mechanosensitive ion channel family protein [Rhizobium sp. PL01]|uniref:mechanosensitive ion channel family protein n=1 Tax=Rhizobium sp. PL01 TaxID=3085631 RepID=UPI002980D76A|nr:mechanosensitive ion channel domain-containing protein [Rhizobium sp. PL01]MDW5318476.1 mechanosensitive ion channel [Rhizobium sp. PL01]
MDFESAVNQTLPWIQSVLLNEWTVYQGAIVIAGYLVATLLARRIEPSLERNARKIKGNPDLLRVVIAFLRRLRWLFLIVWLGISQAMLVRHVLPAHRWMISVALILSAAWLAAAVLTRIIRNKPLSRVAAVAIWVYIALYVVGLDDPILSGLDNASINLGATRLSLLIVLKGIVLTTTLVWLASLVANVSSNWIQRSSDLSPSFKVLISKLIKIGLIILAGVMALTATGVDLTALTVFSGAVGVGIGFGLQKVVSNFISGIIILLDKSIKPGDTITLGETFGSVRDLRSRFVSVITRDGKEYLIPNEDFISQKVVNWSFSSDYVRLDIEFGTSYDSDPHEVVGLAIETASSIPRVKNEHSAPVCWMVGFGASSLDFKLRFWISDPSNGLTNIRGEVLMALWDAFKDADIAIPFPHREIIMKTPVEVIVKTPGRKTGRTAPKNTRGGAGDEKEP